MPAGTAPATDSPGTASGDISTDQAIARLKCLADEKGISLSVSRCRRLVVSHVKRRSTVTDAELQELARAIGYADPTGEEATRNVDRARKDHRP